MENNTPQLNYDESWKYILGSMIENGLKFFYPELFKLIDFKKDIHFVETKLTNYDVGKQNNSKAVDKLIKCYLKNGKKQYILLHIEIEANNPYNICERTFEYYCAIKLKFQDIKVQTLIIFLGKDNPANWQKYEYNFLALEITFKCKCFNIANVNEEELLKSNNPFAYIVLFNKWLLENKKTMEQRFTISKKIFLIIKERKIDVKTIKKIFIFIKKLVSLSNEMEKEINIIINKNYKNMYGNIKSNFQVKEIDKSITRMFKEGKSIKDYIAGGRQEGENIGILKGRQEGQQESVLNLYNKGYNANKIADLLDFDLDFVKNVISKK